MAFVVFDRVKETSITTGTGNFTLAGAMTGFRSFSAVCSTNDTFHYTIQAVDSAGLPTGEWEVGLGTYSATNTLARTTVLSSSNSNAAVNFSAGTKQAWIDIAAADYKNTSRGPAFSAYATSTQSIPNSTPTKLLFDTEEYDTANCYSSSRFTPNVAGYYLICASAVMGANAAYFSLRLHKNGSLYKIGPQHGSTSQGGLAMGMSSTVFLNGTTDYVEIYISQAVGSSVSTYVSSGTGMDVWCNGCYLSA